LLQGVFISAINVAPRGVNVIEKDNSKTKDNILKTSARFFSERGYDKVTIREIAKDVGINPASLYYHFPSKEAILQELYEYYARELERVTPDVNELLELAKTLPPHEVLYRATYSFDKDKQEILDQIRITAVRRLGGDTESEHFIETYVFGTIHGLLRPLLEYFIEQDKIEALDIDTFINVFSYYNFSAGVLVNTTMRHNFEEYIATMNWLFSLIEEK